MLRARFILVLIGFIVILIAASVLIFISIPTPRVVQIEPANGATEIPPTSPITITFATPMQRVETEQNIRFQPRVAGNFSWRDDQTLVFTPRTTLPVSTTLTITVSQDARSRLQRPLENTVRSRFTTLARPYVVESIPARDARFVYVPNMVTIVFSRAMDANMLADSLQIEPALENFSLDMTEKTLRVRGFFEPRTRYTISILPFATDAEYGIALNREYVWSFTAAAQYPNFSILNRGRVLTFSANEPILIPTQFTNVSRLAIAAYPISRAEFDLNAHAPFETWHAFQPASTPAQTFRVETNAILDTYTQQDIRLDALARGTYYLNITTPEGVSDAQLVVVE